MVSAHRSPLKNYPYNSSWKLFCLSVGKKIFYLKKNPTNTGLSKHFWMKDNIVPAQCITAITNMLKFCFFYIDTCKWQKQISFENNPLFCNQGTESSDKYVLQLTCPSHVLHQHVHKIRLQTPEWTNCLSLYPCRMCILTDKNQVFLLKEKSKVSVVSIMKCRKYNML